MSAIDGNTTAAKPIVSMRAHLMAGISLLALAAATLAPNQAAACTTVSTDTSIGSSAGCILWTGGSLTVSGSTIGSTEAI